MSSQPESGIIPELTIAERLHLARYMAGMEIQQLCAATGISRGTVANYESRAWDRRRNPAFIRLWADATGVNYSWLMTGEAGGGDSGPGLRVVNSDGTLTGASRRRERKDPVLPHFMAA